MDHVVRQHQVDLGESVSIVISKVALLRSPFRDYPIRRVLNYVPTIRTLSGVGSVASPSRYPYYFFVTQSFTFPFQRRQLGLAFLFLLMTQSLTFPFPA